jgi:hypothetical protein
MIQKRSKLVPVITCSKEFCWSRSKISKSSWDSEIHSALSNKFKVCNTQRKWNYSILKYFCKIHKVCKHVAFVILRCWNRIWYEINDFSWSMNAIGLDRSFILGLPDLASSQRFVQLSWKREDHLASVRNAKVLCSYADRSSEWICEGLSPLRVKKQITALCSM